ncbi:hypothetical protein [Duganella sp.]|uniref:hypothetical protein n=1 Tax=Duganella sp. TaxID=1904440 RepID=UPI0031D7D225
MSEPHLRWLQRLSNYRLALAQLRKLIDKGQLNELGHTYNKATADKIAALIPSSYFTLFCQFEQRMVELSDAV